MRRQRLASSVGSVIRSGAWWATVAPFCWASDLPRLGAPADHSIHLGGELDHYPVTELLGRLLWFRGRLRLARSLLIVLRGIILGLILLLGARALEVVIRQPPSPWISLAIFVIVGWSIHLALHHTISPFEVARLVDRRMALNAQLATAVEFTLRDRLDRPLARTQIRMATNRLRDVEPRQAIAFVVPGRDLRIVGLVAALYLALSEVSALGLNSPQTVQAIDLELAKQASQEAQSPSPYVQMDAAAFQLQGQTAPLQSNQQTGNQVSDQLNNLQQQLAAQAISSDQYRSGLQQVQQQLQQQAGDSLAAQQALNALAAALKDSSSTAAISTSLTQGDYGAASQQLSNLSQQLGQLSPDARQQLADRLAQAAKQTSKTSPDMSRAAGDTSSGLQQGNTAQASQGMQALANAVQQASGQIAQQSQLGQALENVQQQLGEKPSAQTPTGSTGPDPSAADPGSPSQADPGSQPGASTDSSAGQTPSDQTGSGQSAQTSADQANRPENPAQAGSGTGAGIQTGNMGNASMRATGGQIQQDTAGGGSGIGNGAGANPLSGTNQSLDGNGVRLTIIGKSNSAATGSTSAGGRSDPLTAADASTITNLGGDTAPPSNVTINVHSESNVIPLDRKPVVREYFSNATTSGP
jgi:hypothetical protein